MSVKVNINKAYVQYSKRMTTALLIFWAIIRLASVVLVALNADCGTSMVNIVRGTDDIAMVVVCSYTANSLGEKGITGYFKSRSYEHGKTEEELTEENSNG